MNKFKHSHRSAGPQKHKAVRPRHQSTGRNSRGVDLLDARARRDVYHMVEKVTEFMDPREAIGYLEYMVNRAIPKHVKVHLARLREALAEQQKKKKTKRQGGT